MYIDTVMKKYEGNPIIQPTDIENAYATFNCGQTMYKGQTILLDNYPQDIAYADMTGIQDDQEKERLLAIWKY